MKIKSFLTNLLSGEFMDKLFLNLHSITDKTIEFFVKAFSFNTLLSEVENKNFKNFLISLICLVCCFLFLISFGKINSVLFVVLAFFFPPVFLFMFVYCVISLFCFIVNKEISIELDHED